MRDFCFTCNNHDVLDSAFNFGRLFLVSFGYYLLFHPVVFFSLVLSRIMPLYDSKASSDVRFEPMNSNKKNITVQFSNMNSCLVSIFIGL